MEILYFGCIGQAGHYMWAAAGEHSVRLSRADYRRNVLGRFDGLLCPEGSKQGIVAMSFVQGHTALAFWDQTGDHRGGSSSTFFAEGVHSASAMLDAARISFPGIFERLKKAGVEVVIGDEVTTDKVIEVDLNDPSECHFCQYEQGICMVDDPDDAWKGRNCARDSRKRGVTDYAAMKFASDPVEAPEWCPGRGRVIVQAKDRGDS